MLTLELQQKYLVSDIERMYRQAIAYDDNCQLIELGVMVTLTVPRSGLGLGGTEYA
ncbi:hypothetical protein [[Limnothrix rosea] IAM M-220]|uniref:hypothetical protein n=1 Tax=[Limnothrix rosea] IAM M-220 TaxID=454133 RepID=UPI0015C52D51|nr:hypothetical protein [[Limnothrix rosea] IAM M-220]